MPLIKNGSDYTETYVTLEEANSYLKNNPAYPTWASSDDNTKMLQICSATNFFNTLSWRGEVARKINTLQRLTLANLPLVLDQDQSVTYIPTSTANYHLAHNFNPLPVEDDKLSYRIFGTGSNGSSLKILESLQRAIKGTELGSSTSTSITSFGLGEEYSIFLENINYGEGFPLPIEETATTFVDIDGVGTSLISSIETIQVGSDDIDQHLAFPRTDMPDGLFTIPEDIRIGCILQAAAFVENPSLYLTDNSNLKRAKAGSAEVEYYLINSEVGTNIPSDILNVISPYFLTPSMPSAYVAGSTCTSTARIYYPDYRGV